MDTFAKKTREELIAICKEQKIKGYSSMKKGEIIQLLLPLTLKPVDLQPLDLYANISNENFKNNNLNVLSLFSGCGAGDKTIGIRANLTITYVDIICKYKPLYFIMENVPTIRTIGKSIYDIIIKKLKDESYGLSINVVYMPDYGIPHLIGI